MTGPFSMMESGDIPEAFTPGFLWYINVLYMIAVTVIEPFYVGAGFGLYLNSRTHLEGWDIELTFRRLASRLAPVAAVLMLGLTLAFSISAAAVDSPFREDGDLRPPISEAKAELLDDEAKTAAKKILAEPDFKVHKRTEKIWVPNFKADGPPDGQPGGLPQFAGVFEVIFYGLVLLLVVGGAFWL